MATIRVWDFVEDYYPNYHGSDEIAENDVLQRIVDNEIEGDSEVKFKEIAETLGFEFDNLDDFSTYHVERIQKEARHQLSVSNSEIFDLSIQRYLEQKDELLLNTDLKVLEEIVYVKKHGKTESELGMLLRLGGDVNPNNPKDVLLAQNNSFSWSTKYKRWFDRLYGNSFEVHILNSILKK